MILIWELRKEGDDSIVMEDTKVTEKDLEKIKEFLEQIRFGSVTVIVQDGKIVQIEKHEKVRVNK